MRKPVAIILVCMLVLTGCSSSKWKPERASKDIEPYAEQAIDIIDAYLSFEIDADEATEKFKALSDRVDSMGFDDADSLVDSSLAHKIYMLRWDNADDRTDLEYHQIRDIIAYQIGEDVSGRTYPAEFSESLFYEYPVPRELKVYDAPASDVIFNDTYTSGYNYISVSFDYINGVSSADAVDYATEIMDILLADDAEDPVMFGVSYECYEQNVFSLYVNISADGVSGFVSTKGVDDSTQIKSPDDIRPALENAAEYFKGP